MKCEGRALPPRWRAWLLISSLVYVILLVIIRPTDYVDSFNYAQHIVDHYHGVFPAKADPFWDFGHVLWRPAGSLVWGTFRGPLGALFPGNEVAAAAAGLIALSVIGGLAGAIVLYLLLARLTGEAWVAGIATIGFLATHASLDYFWTGMAYTLGIALQIAGLYVLCRSAQERWLGVTRGLAAGFFFGAAICLWFPFVLAMAGLLCFGLIWRDDDKPLDLRARLPFLLAVTGGVALTCIAAYAGAMASRHIASVQEAAAWVVRSRYGIVPWKGYLRMVAGIARAFYSLGDDALVWKRLLFRDAATKVTLAEAARTGIWKLAAVYGVLGMLIWRLCKSIRGRRLLVCLVLNTVPVAIFAAFLFDPSPSVRFMETFPLLFVAFAWVASAERPGTFGRVIVPLFYASMLVVNCVDMSRFRADTELLPGLRRWQAVNPVLGPKDRILIPAFRDSLDIFTQARPLDPESRHRSLTAIVVPKGTDRVTFWQTDTAAKVFETWQRGGRVWASRRLLAAEPAPEWNWVEGDDPRVKWADLPAFFRQLEFRPGFGGADGFAELVHSDRNERALRAATKSQ